MAKDIDVLFTKDEEQRIIEAIQEAENHTSGEIRVHITQQTDDDALKTTQEIFQELRMFNTKDRNGVLLHISMASKKFAIFGDVGINQVVPEDFWNSTTQIMELEFKSGKIVDGICKGISEIGTQLQNHFPWDRNDKNELSDNISYD